MYILYIFLGILFFGILIGVHEFGHFSTAKLFGIKVNEFAIGMGPAIWKKEKGETLYALRCIPIGGYCAMEGEDEDSDDPRAFGNAKWWKKIVVLVAGAFMNLLLAYLLVFFMVGFSSYYKEIPHTTLESVEVGSSFEGYLQPGDQILEIDGEKVFATGDVTGLMAYNLSGKADVHDITVIRNGEKLFFDDMNTEARELPDYNGEIRLRLGLNFQVSQRNLWNTASYSWNLCCNHVRSVWLSLKMLFRGALSFKDLGGPVYIVKAMADVGSGSESVSDGFLNFVSIGALIAANLGVMNLLPIPALDGGRVVGVFLTAVIEGITKKKLNPKIEGYVHGIGMVLLLALMVLIFFKDIFFIVR